jgi:hypothetical protein
VMLDFPASLAARLEIVAEHERKPTRVLGHGEQIPNGQRNDRLTSIAGGLRHKGMEKAEIAVELLAINETLCKPPLREDEVHRIARSVAKYPVRSLRRTGGTYAIYSAGSPNRTARGGSWIDRQIASFTPTSQFAAHAQLMSIAHHARENFPNDPYSAYGMYIDRIREEAGTTPQVVQLIYDTMDAAWEDDRKHPLFVPLTLEESRSPLRTILDTKSVAINSTACRDTNAIVEDRHEIQEDVVCTGTAKAAYDGLYAICRDRGLPKHCVSVALSDLAKEIGYGTAVRPDASRALKAVRDAEAANILVTLVHGEACGPLTPVTLRKSNIYCLRGAGETKEAAVAHGQLQHGFKRRMSAQADPPETPDIDLKETTVTDAAA